MEWNKTTDDAKRIQEVETKRNMGMIVYKLTDSEGYTRRGYNNETLWGEGVTHEALGVGVAMCTDSVLHFYDSPEVAALMNEAHADIKNPVCWESEIDATAVHDGLKGGAKRLTTLRRIDLPVITYVQAVEIALRITMRLPGLPAEWTEWAGKWLSGIDRSKEAAWAAVAAEAVVAAEARAVEAEARAAVALAAEAAAWAAVAVGVAWAAKANAVEAVAWAAMARAKGKEFAKELTLIIREVLEREITR